MLHFETTEEERIRRENLDKMLSTLVPGDRIKVNWGKSPYKAKILEHWKESRTFIIRIYSLTILNFPIFYHDRIEHYHDGLFRNFIDLNGEEYGFK